MDAFVLLILWENERQEVSGLGFMDSDQQFAKEEEKEKEEEGSWVVK